VKVYKITQANGPCSPLIVDSLAVLPDLWGDVGYEEVGNKYLIEVIDMPEGEFRRLGEWGGF